jgi:hypothetical protein
MYWRKDIGCESARTHSQGVKLLESDKHAEALSNADTPRRNLDIDTAELAEPAF